MLCRDEGYEVMLEAFREDIRFDGQADGRAVRKEPEELEQLRRNLRHDQPGSDRGQPELGAFG